MQISASPRPETCTLYLFSHCCGITAQLNTFYFFCLWRLCTLLTYLTKKNRGSSICSLYTNTYLIILYIQKYVSITDVKPIRNTLYFYTYIHQSRTSNKIHGFIRKRLFLPLLHVIKPRSPIKIFKECRSTTCLLLKYVLLTNRRQDFGVV